MFGRKVKFYCAFDEELRLMFGILICILQTYLGIQIFRFYFKCTKCSAEIAFKTDPQNSDYVVESGASRNFEPWRDEDEVSDYANAP